MSKPSSRLATPSKEPSAYPTYSFTQVRETLLARKEILLADLREEDPFAQGHPLWAANFPIGRIELEAWDRVPRRDATIVLYGRDGDNDLAPGGAKKFTELGYTNVYLFEGGLEGWIAAGGEIFIDVNVPSKAFGELVEAERHTPLLDAERVKALLDEGADAVVLDARRFDEYQTMNIPGSVSVPGAELVLRIRELAPDPKTKVIINCAGRTRSIIGTQSLINAGIPNEVVGLRNGTIAWTLAGLKLETGADRSFLPVNEATLEHARRAARDVADRAGASRISAEDVETLADEDRTFYRFDVRSLAEYVDGHLPGFLHVPGGQLIQETDHYAPVRGARIAVSDNDGVRANMTASWLAQMGWDVYVVEEGAGIVKETGMGEANLPSAPKASTLKPAELAELLASDGSAGVALLDFSASANYIRRHIPGAAFALRSQLAKVVEDTRDAKEYILTCGTSTLACFVARDLGSLTDRPVRVLEGGTSAWIEAGLPLEDHETRFASPRIDRYRRPYEGTDAPVAAMQAYLC